MPDYPDPALFRVNSNSSAVAHHTAKQRLSNLFLDARHPNSRRSRMLIAVFSMYDCNPFMIRKRGRWQMSFRKWLVSADQYIIGVVSVKYIVYYCNGLLRTMSPRKAQRERPLQMQNLAPLRNKPTIECRRYAGSTHAGFTLTRLYNRTQSPFCDPDLRVARTHTKSQEPTLISRH